MCTINMRSSALRDVSFSSSSSAWSDITDGSIIIIKLQSVISAHYPACNTLFWLVAIETWGHISIVEEGFLPLAFDLSFITATGARAAS